MVLDYEYWGRNKYYFGRICLSAIAISVFLTQDVVNQACYPTGTMETSWHKGMILICLPLGVGVVFIRTIETLGKSLNLPRAVVKKESPLN